MMATTTASFRGTQYEFGPDATYTNFPNTFNDFFSKLNGNEDGEDTVVAMLEDKFIPRGGSAANCSGDADSVVKNCRRQGRRGGIYKRSFHRRASEYHSRAHHQVGTTPSPQPPPTASRDRLLEAGDRSPSRSVSPAPGRRRSSSIAVTRQPPDLHRFLLGEQQQQRCPRGRPTSPGPPGLVRAVSPRPRPTTLENHYRSRTSSMPAVPRHRNRIKSVTWKNVDKLAEFSVCSPMLGQLRRTDDVGEDVEYYRVRSFSITPNGIFNLGDSFRSRRSRSINSASSSGSSQSINSTPSHRERVPSTTSQCSTKDGDEPPRVPRFKVAMLGASGVGKTALTCQFTTSEYICAYDTSLDEEFGQKTVSVMLDGREAELEIVDHPSSEMSVESYCATYSPEVFVVVYSVVDRNSFKAAEDILLFLWKSDYISSKGVILVGNKADLERKREVPLAVGRKLANSCNCKFIETSSGLAHNVDELLVGILAQVQLNPRRDREKLNKKTKKQKVRIGSGKRILKHLLGIKNKSRSCENLFVL